MKRTTSPSATVAVKYDTRSGHLRRGPSGKRLAHFHFPTPVACSKSRVMARRLWFGMRAFEARRQSSARMSWSCITFRGFGTQGLRL